MPKFAPPKLDNYTNGAIVDELGKIKAIAAWAKFMEGYHKEALYARIGKTEQTLPQGEKYGGSVSKETRENIVADLVRALLSEKDLAKVTKVSEIFVMRITPSGMDAVELTQSLKNLILELGLDD
jgi:hypothetical protein